jgi:hypothetical protein
MIFGHGTGTMRLASADGREPEQRVIDHYDLLSIPWPAEAGMNHEMRMNHGGGPRD